MNQDKRLFIRADASTAIGTGHVMRCIALGQAWQDKGGRVVFISHCESKKLRERIIAEGFDFIYIENPHPHPSDLDKTIETLSTIHHQPSTNDWLVVDGYHFDSMYQKKIKEAGYKLLWIDDYGHAEHYYAEIVLNQNISAEESFYNRREPTTRLLLGTRYVLLRREFRQWQGCLREVPDTAKKILVTLGGGDPDNVTLKVVQALKRVDISWLEAKIVVGPTNPNLHALQQEVSDNENLQIITNTTNMPELMAWADLAVSAGGSTCWEMAFMGLPNLIIVFADNQVKIAKRLHDYGISINMGWHHDVRVPDIAKSLNNLIMSSVMRRNMLCAEAKYIDGKGCERIIGDMCCGNIFLRTATKEDCELLFKWVNDSDARRSAFCSEPISFDVHEKWYRDKMKSDKFIQFIAFTQDQKAIGQVRFDILNDEAEVDISVAKEFRGLGYGVCLIKKAVNLVEKNNGTCIFRANVKIHNKASIKSFEKAGFSQQGSCVVSGHQAVQLVYYHQQY